jgi:ketosteroid isomerase-like protein
MSRKNVGRIRGAIAYFNQHGIPDLEGLDPDVEWWTPADLPDAGVHRGHDEVRRHLSSWARSFEEFHAEPLDFIDAEDQVIVRLVLRGRLKGSDTWVQQPDLVQLWRFRGETAVEIREYRTVDDALRAAGLREADAHDARSA